MLSQTLKSLERDGLVSRKAIPTVPVTVEYAITPLGRTLSDTVDALRVWAENHMGQVLEAQQASMMPAEPGARPPDQAIALQTLTYRAPAL